MQGGPAPATCFSTEGDNDSKLQREGLRYARCCVPTAGAAQALRSANANIGCSNASCRTPRHHLANAAPDHGNSCFS